MNDLIATIKKGYYNFEADEWANVSIEAKDLINNLIVVEPCKRFVPSTALKHKWFLDTVTNFRQLINKSSALNVQKNLKKNKRKLTKSNININNINNLKRMSFNMDIKNAMENLEAVNKLRIENDNEKSFTDSDPPSIEEMLDE